MVRNLAHDLSCAVCGIDTKRHSGWFLVSQNCWVDRISVLSWHPLLARERRIRGVCGKECLRTILTHWLNHANLQLIAAGATGLPTTIYPATGADTAFPVGRVVGELAVQRESASQVWTGSPEAMECILNALIGGLGRQSWEPGVPLINRSQGYSRELVFLS